MKCYYCGQEVPETAEKCPACYCPLQGGKKEASEFAQSQLRIAELQAEDVLEKVIKGRYVFYGIAALFLLQTIVIFARESYGVNTLGMGLAGSVLTAVFAAFGFFFPKSPMVFSIIGLCVSFLFFGSFIWVVSVIVMGLCIYYSYNYVRVQKQLKEIKGRLARINE